MPDFGKLYTDRLTYYMSIFGNTSQAYARAGIDLNLAIANWHKLELEAHIARVEILKGDAERKRAREAQKKATRVNEPSLLQQATDLGSQMWSTTSGPSLFGGW